MEIMNDGQEFKQARKPQKYQNMTTELIDNLFAFALLAVGFLFWLFYSPANLDIGMYIFTIVLSGFTGAYLHAKGFKQNRKSLIALAVLLLLSTVFLLFDNAFEKFLNDIFIKFVFVYWVILTTKNTTDDRLSSYAVLDVLHQIFVKGFSNFLVLPNIISASNMKSKNRGKFLSALLGFVIMIPVLVTVIFLLVNADLMFKSLISSATNLVSEDLFTYIFKFIIGIPIAFYLYSLIWGNLQTDQSMNIKNQSEKALKAFSFVPRTTVHTALAALNFIYLLFFLSQSAYLFSAFKNVLPDGMTYAEYARTGFFELCFVVIINLCVMVFAYLFIKKPATKVLSIQGGLLSLFTLLLIITSISKMLLYIETYGLTLLRVYISLFLIMLFVIFLAVLIRQFLKFNMGRAIIITVTVFFIALCYGNIDGQIAKYNISGYLAGDLKLMDAEFMEELSDGAIPYLYEGYEKAVTEKDKKVLEEAILETNKEESSFKNFNLQKYRADKIRQELSKKASS